MKFPETVLRLVTMKQIKKEDRMYTFVKLADAKTLDSNEFMLSSEQNADNLIVQKDYRVTLDIDGKFSSVTLLPEKAS